MDFIEQEIAPFDPPMPKTHGIEPKMECIECTVCKIFTFKLRVYCDLETKVQGNSRSSTAALFENYRITGLSDSERISMICSAVLIKSTRVTDGRTYRLTETELPYHIRTVAYM